jgi:ATP-dependent Lhr-like helicase
MTNLPQPISDWFAARGWDIHPHQQSMLDAAQAASTLLIAPAGGGKTMAGFLPSLADLHAALRRGLHTLYISQTEII